MSWLLPKSPKMPEPAKLPPVPERSDADIATAAAEQRKRFYTESAGRRSTLGGGLDGGGYSTASAKLLGVA